MNGEHDDDLDISLDPAVEKPPGASRDFTVRLDRDVHLQMVSYARTDLSRELGGVILGHYEQRGEKTLIRVMAAIEARDAERQRTSVKFTHESWAYINQVKDRMFPDLKIVGWFHTHPGFGIFLSKFDKFIQGNFFNLSWQVAYVIDPVANKEGFFRWEGQEIIPCAYEAEETGYNNGGYLLPGQQEGALPETEAPAVEIPAYQVIEAQRSGYKWGRIMVSLVVLAGLALASYNIGIKQGRTHKEALPPVPASVPQVVQVEIPGEVVYKYKVRRGDSLWTISEMFYGTGFRYEEIAGYNNLPSHRDIKPGQILIIPNVEEVKI